MDRRSFLTMTAGAVAAAAAPVTSSQQTAPSKARFSTGLVAYSYRQALQSKAMKYEDLINVAVDTGTDGIDMTVYWLPSTEPDYLRSLRRLAYKNRVEIYSIGTRVQLAQPSPDLQEKQLADLRKWIEVAQRVGATHIRVFGGQKPDGATLEQAVGFAAETLKRGAEIAGPAGVLLGIEDDGGITDFAKETIEIVRRADSPYAGMNLDTGNFRPPKVYDQIEMSIPYAVSTHIKTETANDDGKTRSPADWDRVFKMFAAHGYRGYMGLEYEAAADAQTAIPAQLRRLKEMAQKYSS
ncbi:MAG TPA: sugar phosphate isomerase/epimerase family protein [Vicinamibacterales bacterium]|nr:sugar phosphate isomerase/epimerase family protein [Vicinamibacterales bacterium]